MFDVVGPLDALQTILQGINGVQDAVQGVPRSFSAIVSVYVTVSSSQVISEASGGYLVKYQSYLIGFSYRVRDAEETAERTLAGFVDDFVRAVYSNRTLGGTVESVELDFSLNDVPDYQARLGQEVRHYLIKANCKQSETIPSS